jgi:hypothetical protein
MAERLALRVDPTMVKNINTLDKLKKSTVILILCILPQARLGKKKTRMRNALLVSIEIQAEQI